MYLGYPANLFAKGRAIAFLPPRSPKAWQRDGDIGSIGFARSKSHILVEAGRCDGLPGITSGEGREKGGMSQ